MYFQEVKINVYIIDVDNNRNLLPVNINLKRETGQDYNVELNSEVKVLAIFSIGADFIDNLVRNSIENVNYKKRKEEVCLQMVEEDENIV